MLYFSAGLLWVLLIALGISLAFIVTASGEGITSGERAIAIAVVLLLATPVLLTLRSTRRQIRDMTRNQIVLDDRGIRFHLGGRAREWKGLPEVTATVPWPELRSIEREWQRFAYPSAVPFGYKLEVFTVHHVHGQIAFTKECVEHAKVIAEKIAARAGGSV